MAGEPAVRGGERDTETAPLRASTLPVLPQNVVLNCLKYKLQICNSRMILPNAIPRRILNT